jgi:hypothetical protein
MRRAEPAPTTRWAKTTVEQRDPSFHFLPPRLNAASRDPRVGSLLNRGPESPGSWPSARRGGGRCGRPRPRSRRCRRVSVLIRLDWLRGRDRAHNPKVAGSNRVGDSLRTGIRREALDDAMPRSRLHLDAIGVEHIAHARADDPVQLAGLGAHLTLPAMRSLLKRPSEVRECPQREQIHAQE